MCCGHLDRLNGRPPGRGEVELRRVYRQFCRLRHSYRHRAGRFRAQRHAIGPGSSFRNGELARLHQQSALLIVDDPARRRGNQQGRAARIAQDRGQRLRLLVDAVVDQRHLDHLRGGRCGRERQPPSRLPVVGALRGGAVLGAVCDGHRLAVCMAQADGKAQRPVCFRRAGRRDRQSGLPILWRDADRGAFGLRVVRLAAGRLFRTAFGRG